MLTDAAAESGWTHAVAAVQSAIVVVQRATIHATAQTPQHQILLSSDEIRLQPGHSQRQGALRGAAGTANGGVPQRDQVQAEQTHEEARGGHVGRISECTGCRFIVKALIFILQLLYRD